MKLRVKSNGVEVEMKSSDFNKFTDDQKKSYTIISIEDAKEEPKQVVENTAKKEVKAVKPEEK